MWTIGTLDTNNDDVIDVEEKRFSWHVLVSCCVHFENALKWEFFKLEMLCFSESSAIQSILGV